MRTSIYLFIALVLFTNCLLAQKSSIDKYLLLKPSDIKAIKSGIQKYDVSLKWQNLDAINGNNQIIHFKFWQTRALVLANLGWHHSFAMKYFCSSWGLF